MLYVYLSFCVSVSVLGMLRVLCILYVLCSVYALSVLLIVCSACYIYICIYFSFLFW